MDILTDQVIMAWYQSHTIVVAAIPAVVIFCLKLAAIVHPGIRTDKIRDLITEMWPWGKKA